MSRIRNGSHPAGLIILLLVLAVSGFGISLFQGKAPEAKPVIVKLKYNGEDEPTKVNDDLRPLVVSANRMLVPVGDTLYMLDAKNQVVWNYSFEPNIIFDVLTTPEGTIYAAASDGLLIALDAAGKRVWGNDGMCGSGNYTQLANYEGGFLTVLSMEAYRAGKSSNAEDILAFWKDRKVVWSKAFPRGAELFVWGGKVLAVTRTKDGREIREIQ